MLIQEHLLWKIITLGVNSDDYILLTAAELQRTLVVFFGMRVTMFLFLMMVHLPKRQ